jgi:hypothetical protein
MRGESTKIPVSPAPRLYQLSTGENGERTHIPVMDLPEQTEGAQLLLIFYRTESGDSGSLFLDDSPEAHPVKTIRAVNLTPANLAVNIGGSPQVVAPGAVVLLGTPAFQDPEHLHFNFVYSLTGQNAWESPTQRLRFREGDHRLLVIYTALPVIQDSNIEGPNGFVEREADAQPPEVIYQPVLLRLYD